MIRSVLAIARDRRLHLRGEDGCERAPRQHLVHRNDHRAAIVVAQLEVGAALADFGAANLAEGPRYLLPWS